HFYLTAGRFVPTAAPETGDRSCRPHLRGPIREPARVPGHHPLILVCEALRPDHRPLFTLRHGDIAPVPPIRTRASSAGWGLIEFKDLRRSRDPQGLDPSSTKGRDLRRADG